jgi:hypothetical protein
MGSPAKGRSFGARGELSVKEITRFWDRLQLGYATWRKTLARMDSWATVGKTTDSLCFKGLSGQNEW